MVMVSSRWEVAKSGPDIIIDLTRGGGRVIRR